MRARHCKDILLPLATALAAVLAAVLAGCSQPSSSPIGSWPGASSRMPWEKPAPPPAPTPKKELQEGRLVTVTPVPGTPAGDAELIRRRVEKRQYNEAMEEGAVALKKHLDDEVAREDIMLWMSEAEIGRGNLYEAYERLEKMLAEYPNGRHFDRALDREFEVADKFLKGAKRPAVNGMLKLGAKDEGIKILEGIADHSPNGPMAEKALLRIAEYYTTNKKYADAVGAYDRYLKLFPKGPQASFAMLQGAKCSMSQYIDARFDETPLHEAEQRYRDFQQSFPAEAAKQRVDETIVTIHLLLAEKLYKIGQYYETTRPSPERRRAAAFYYQQAVKDYPTTAWAERSRGCLRRLGITPPATPGLPKPDLMEREEPTQP